MKQWNDTIIANATFFKSQPLVPYNVDGSLTLSGVLDVSRQVKARVKAYAYAYRVTGDQGWVNRCWDELQVIFFRTWDGTLYLFWNRMQPEIARSHSAKRLTTGTLSISSTSLSSHPRLVLPMTGYMTNGMTTRRVRSCGQ
jgi:hypothetical protein